MIDDSINHEYIIRYLRDNSPEMTPFLADLRAFAEENDVPIAEPETAALLKFLCGIKRPERILEIGTAIAYSSILMAQSSDAHIVTLERNEEMFALANENIKKAGLENRIQVVLGDACETIKSIEGTFDIVFIDASKGHYKEFFENSHVSENGIIICDNVLYKGMTATDELVQHRKVTIVKRLRKFIKDICFDDKYYSTLLPIGDGVLLIYRK